MCGIAGVVRVDREGVEAATRRMMRAMIHRGPDDEGYEHFGFGGRGSGATLGLGFRRLAIMDISPRGHQPMVDDQTGNALVFNGEIYNFVELRRKLGSLGKSFQSKGDTEVLLHALSVWGEKALDVLDGMFAFAFYEAAGRRVLLARDPLGIKPLYVAQVPGAVVFASEVRAILASGMVPSALDPSGMASFLAFGAPQDPLTLHRHVRSMPAGSCEWLDERGLDGRPLRPRRYWNFPSGGRVVVNDRNAAAAVAARLEDSVQRQCIADVPLAVFLSGGLDSGTMAALARTGDEPPRTFAVGFDGPRTVDETVAAAETAAFLGTQHFQTIVDADWVQLQWAEWLKAADRPSIDGLNTYIVSGAVRDRDIVVAISGLGADELFGGYPSFQRVPRMWRAVQVLGWLPRTARRQAARVIFAALPSAKRAKALDLLSGSSSPIELTALSRRLLDNETLASLGFPSPPPGLSSSFLPVEAYDAFGGTAVDAFSAVSRAELGLYMGNTLLRDADINSMAHSLELRVPFLGRDVVEYALELPARVRAPAGSAPKHVLRLAMAGRLPETVFSRPKLGFTLPFGNWLFGPLRDQSEAAIDTLAACPLLDSHAVRRIWSSCAQPGGATHWSRPMALVVLGSYLLHRG